MLALIAGSGDLPAALIAALDTPPLVCALQSSNPDVPVDMTFRLEHLGAFLRRLKERGVTEICMAGAVKRPKIDPSLIGPDTLPLVPRIQTALQSGDDAALRAIISIFEDAGFDVHAAHEIAPDLLPAAGVLTRAAPPASADAAAALGEREIATMGAADIGQACVVRRDRVLAREDQDGTDAMLLRLATPQERAAGLSTAGDDLPVDAAGAVLFKAAKPGQDMRADLPVIGANTARVASAAGLAGIVIEAGHVMVLDLPEVTRLLDARGLFLWVRPRGGS